MSIITNFNPNMQILARDYRMFTQKQLSSKTKIPQSVLSKYETGLLNPTSEHLSLIAEALEFPYEFFVQDGQIFSIITPFHRKKSTLPKKELHRAESVGNLMRMHIDRLISRMDLEIECDIPRFEVDHFYGSNGAVGIAQAVREYFNIPRGPISSMVTFLEDHGALIAYVSDLPQKLDGFTLLLDDHLPFIICNSSYQGEKIRMTLAHELGHIVMHRIFHDRCEEEAWDFAAEFLMPREDIIHEFPRRLTRIADLIPLKQRWKVSVSALVMRAQKLGLITERTSRYLYMQLSQYGRAEPIPIPAEQPQFIRSLLEYYSTDLEYSDEDLAKTVSIYNTTFADLYRPKMKNRLAFA